MISTALNRAGRRLALGARANSLPNLSDEIPTQLQLAYNSVRALTSTSLPCFPDLQVKVPPLGESITDGAIAAIMKRPGDAVEEDDALLSIETDKVTVDVRTPVAGFVKSVLVSENDSVEVGRVVAVVTEGEARGAAESTPETAVEERRETSSKVTHVAFVDDQDVVAAAESMERVFGGATGLNQSSGSNGSSGRYVPSISFPSRRTADGRMISELPAMDQKRIRAEELSAMYSANFFLRANQAIHGGGGARGEPLAQRRAMSDREMEMIMLGGAE